MTTASAPPWLRLRTPEDVLAAVPYLLGFHPSDSLVVLGLAGKRLRFHVRGDLAPEGAARDLLDGLADYYADVFEAHRIGAVLLVGFGDGRRVTPLISAVQQAMRRRRIEVRDMLRANDGRFWSYLCDAPECCPPEGKSYEIVGSAVAAAATVAGCVALPDRGAVVRSLAPPVGFALAAMEQATDRAELRMLDLLRRKDVLSAARTAGDEIISAAYARYATDGRLDDDEVAWLSLLLHLVSVRDIAWRRIDSDGQDGREVHERLWTDVIRRCEPGLVAPPAMLLSYTMWRSGDGLRARIAVERALDADPDYSAAKLMADVLDRAVPPSALDRLRRRERQRRQGRARVRRRRGS